MKPGPAPAGFDIPIGALTFTVPDRRMKIPGLLWESLAWAAELEHDGYEALAIDELAKISAWLKRPAPELDASPVELPDHERGRGPDELRRFDRLNAQLSRGDLKAEKREDKLRERERLERRPGEILDQAWRDSTKAETAALAQARGEEIDHQPKRPLRVVSRDPIASLLRKGHLSTAQYDCAVELRDCYEARSEGVGSQLGAINSIGGAHNNDQFVLNGLQRAKRLQRIGRVERMMMLAPQFAAAKSHANVGLAMIKGVCGQGIALSAYGDGRAFERNLIAFKIALDVAKEMGR